jgi:cytochrome c oxidase subunit 2
MPIVVKVLPKADYQVWLAQQKAANAPAAPAAAPAAPEAAPAEAPAATTGSEG